MTSLYPALYNFVSFCTHVGYSTDHASAPCLNKDVLAKVPSKSKLAILFEGWMLGDSKYSNVPFHFQGGTWLPVPSDVEIPVPFESSKNAKHRLSMTQTCGTKFLQVLIFASFPAVCKNKVKLRFRDGVGE